MDMNLREVIKKIGITQQELADYLGITRQYLNSYLDETMDEARLPQKYLDNILFLFECKTRSDLFNPDTNRSAKSIRKRMTMIKSTKESIDNLFNVENEEKFELFKMIEYFHSLTKIDDKLLEALSILIENIANDPLSHPLLSYIGKRYMIIDFEDERYNSDLNKAKETLIYMALDDRKLNFEQYSDIYEEFKLSTKKQQNIDLEALKVSLNELGYTNISQKEVVDILKKYNQIKTK